MNVLEACIILYKNCQLLRETLPKNFRALAYFFGALCTFRQTPDVMLNLSFDLRVRLSGTGPHYCLMTLNDLSLGSCNLDLVIISF